jgi:hypothetical protein
VQRSANQGNKRAGHMSWTEKKVEQFAGRGLYHSPTKNLTDL